MAKRKIIILLLFLFLIFRSCSLLELGLRQKYETQTEGITYTASQLLIAEIKAAEIITEYRNIKIQIIISLLLIILLIWLPLLLKRRT